MTTIDWLHLLLGRLSWDALPFWSAIQNPTTSNIVNGVIATGAAGLVVIGAIVVPLLITWYGKWRTLWFEWLTSVDHKRIGIMYIVLAFVMLARAVIEAVLMRTQQAVGLGGGFLSPEHFAQLFSTHGSIMIFFMAMPFLIGLINYVMPLQIGARDVSFPVMNSISLGLTAAGAGLVMVSLIFSKFSTGGWSGYPPYTEMAFNPGVGPDYWIWAVTLSSIGTTMTGINFAVTIYKKRAPGMHLLRMPLFCWTALCTSILMIFAMPPLTVATLLLALDRYLDFHFFTNDLGGNMMNYANLFWLFGHPEVYIVVLPAFGVYSEVFSTFSAKRLYGYTSLVYATMAIAVLSFTVWLHHFFTMGQSAHVNAVFGMATMMIGIPTGVKIYDWMLTMFRGRVRFTVPMLYALAFVMLFVIGGLTGVILANPTIDYQVHNTLFLVAHFHNVLIPGTLFGMLAGYHFWFPKAFGFRLDERWGRIAFACWAAGFVLAFFPLYALGLLGMPRRTVAFFDPAYLPYTLVAVVGAVLVLCALASLFVQLWVSIRKREENRVYAGDPWNGRSLEWATSAPPPEYNFPVLPEVSDRDPFAVAKEHGNAYQRPKEYADIELPRNSAMGMIICVATAFTAFGLVWYMWWLAILGMLVTWGAVIARSFVRETTKIIPADKVEETDRRWLQAVAKARPVSRDDELEPANRGLAEAAA
ncbi:MAG: cbb3-type cytochrome c oxidase subunit I [Gammaproteobacteria bacterium]|jgi:cytochrome o ubiquinol oxidase subunit 1